MRYELTDQEWTAIKPMLPNKPRGVPRVNDRRVLNGIFWVLHSGAPWRDLPGAFGPLTPLATIASFAGGGPVSGAVSMSHGAVTRSWRNAARKVRVCQWPYGTLALIRCPRGAHPRNGAILVLVHVSSMKTSRAGSIRLRYLHHCARRRTMSRRLCSAAISVFFCDWASRGERTPTPNGNRPSGRARPVRQPARAR